MKSIAVMLKPEAAHAWRGTRAAAEDEGAELQRLREIVSRLGIQLAPMHPNTQHESLLPYFTAGMVSDQQAEAVAEELRKSPLVDAAYVKPAPAPPQD